jgi:hypothetical protein
VKVKQHDAVRPSPTAHQARRRASRFCHKCGGPMAISPGSLNGVRCFNCGAQPGIVTPATLSSTPRDIILPRPSGPPPARMYPVPMAVVRRSATPETRLSDALSIGLSWPVASMDLAGVRSWISDLPLQSKGAIITAAAAGVGMAIALTVTVTLA